MDIEKEFLNKTPIAISNYITKTVRRRTHKKRRIDKKWLKKYGYKEVQDESKAYMIDGKLFMSQKCYDKIRTLLELEAKVFTYESIIKNSNLLQSLIIELQITYNMEQLKVGVKE